MGTIYVQDSFTSTGVEEEIDLPAGSDHFVVRNLTQEATTQTPGRGVKFEWFNNPFFADNSQIRTFKSDGANTLESTFDTTGGFTYRKTPLFQEGAVTGTAITNASPAVVSMTNTYSEGDVVALYGTTGMRQIAGMEFTISSVSGAAFTLLGLDASSFTAAATAVISRRIAKSKSVKPFVNFVTGISQAPQAVVTLSKIHEYSVGQMIHFSVPSSFGMTEIDQKVGRVVSVTDYTFTVDLNSSSFSTFSFPPDSLVPVTQLFATVAPQGQRNEYNVTTVPFRAGDFVPNMSLPAGINSPAGSSGDVIVWESWKQEN